MGRDPAKKPAGMTGGKHPLYEVWFVEGALRRLESSLLGRAKMDKRRARQEVNILASMLDEWRKQQAQHDLTVSRVHDHLRDLDSLLDQRGEPDSRYVIGEINGLRHTLDEWLTAQGIRERSF